MVFPIPFPEQLCSGTVLLRPLTDEDWRLEYELSRVPDVPQWTYYPSNLDELGARRRISLARERRRDRLAARYAIVVDDDAVGTAGMGWNDRGEPEVFYALQPAGRGRGAATVSVQLLIAWLFEHGFPSVALETVAGNIASERVAERAGFQQTGSYTGLQRGDSVQVMRWQKNQPCPGKVSVVFR